MVMVIAEIGVNHGGNVALAHRMILAAKKAGADTCKFQTYQADTLEPPGPRREMLRNYQLSHADHFHLNDIARHAGIEFMSTPFDVDSLKFLVEEVGVKTLKIASGNLDNGPLLEAAAKSGRTVILSTGMAILARVRWAASMFQNLTVLHCTSSYPTVLEDVNLWALAMMQKKLGGKVGLSDHTRSLVVPAAAVAMGAVVIEKHMTLDRDMEGPDHRASLEPHEFAEMVRNIREVETALGDGVKAPRECEAGTMKVIEERRAWRER